MINREPLGALPAQDANIIDKLANQFWAEYGEGWRDVADKLDPVQFKRDASYLEEITDVRGAPGARYMFFGVRDRRAMTELFLLREISTGEIVMSYTSGDNVISHRVTGAKWGMMGLTFTYGQGRNEGSFRFPTGARDYYKEIFNFYEHVFLCPRHGFTSSDFLAWSAKHSLGVPKRKFEQLGRLIAEPVEATLTGKNIDFLTHWFRSPIGDKSRIHEIFCLLGRNGPGSLISLLRAAMVLEGLPSNPATFLRGNGGAASILISLASGNRDAHADIARTIAQTPQFHHVEGLLTSDDISKQFREARWWYVTAMVGARMAYSMALEERDPKKALWPRTVFATIFGLRTVCPIVAAQNKPASASLQKELNLLTSVDEPSWFFDAPPIPARVNKWLSDRNVPSLDTTLPSHWMLGEWNPQQVVVKFLTDMCSSDDTLEEKRVNRTYNALVGGRDWKKFDPLIWRSWNQDRMLAERGLFVFAKHLNEHLGMTVIHPDGKEGVCPRWSPETAEGGQPPAAAHENIEEELLNALKSLSRDLRHSRRHNRCHGRW